MQSVTFNRIPDVLQTGSPEEVDQYLALKLFRTSSPSTTAQEVIDWKKCLEARGAEFSSHVAVCLYWLSEHGESIDGLSQVGRSIRLKHAYGGSASVTVRPDGNNGWIVEIVRREIGRRFVVVVATEEMANELAAKYRSDY